MVHSKTADGLFQDHLMHLLSIVYTCNFFPSGSTREGDAWEQHCLQVSFEVTRVAWKYNVIPSMLLGLNPGNSCPQCSGNTRRTAVVQDRSPASSQEQLWMESKYTSDQSCPDCPHNCKSSSSRSITFWLKIIFMIPLILLTLNVILHCGQSMLVKDWENSFLLGF